MTASQADLSCSYGLKNAYSMAVDWSEVSNKLLTVEEGWVLDARVHASAVTMSSIHQQAASLCGGHAALGFRGLGALLLRPHTSDALCPVILRWLSCLTVRWWW